MSSRLRRCQGQPLVCRIWRLLAVGVVVCGFSGAALARTAAATTSIDIETGQARGTIAPAVMGSDYLYPFAGMGSFDSSTDSFFPSFLTDLSDDVFTGSLRFPGGITADFYQWKRAIGPQSQRQGNAYGPNTASSPSTVGPDEFGALLDDTGASGVMTTNFSTGSAQDAADEVEYMTGMDQSNSWVAQRAANGHSQPFDVPVWEVGNEEQSAANSWRNGTPVSVGGPSTCVGTTDCEYIYGGTTSFTAQPVVGAADRSPQADLSEGTRNQSFFVRFPPVVPGSQTILVGGQQWTEVSSLAKAAAGANVYTIDDTTGEITFGDGVHGAIPTNGLQITAGYKSGPHDGFNAYYQAMKQANPNIQVCSTDTTTNFLQDMGSTLPYDCLQVHPYEAIKDTAGDIDDFEKTIMTAPDSEVANLQGWQTAIQSAAGHPIPLDVSEYGSIIGDTPDPGLQPYFYDSLDEALLNASQLADWITLGITVGDRQLLTAEMPAAANVTAGLPDAAPFATTGAIVTPGPGTVVQPTGEYCKLFEPMAGGTLLGTTTLNNPVLTTSGTTTVADLSVVAAENGNGSAIDTVVINRSPTDSVSSELDLNGSGIDGQATVTVLNGADALSFNTSSDPTAVTTTSSTANVSDGAVDLTFPAHSISLVQVNGAGNGGAVGTPPSAPGGGTATTPVGAAPPVVSPGRAPAVSQPVRTPPVEAKPKQITPVTIEAIKLHSATVTWCDHCTYPKTELTFKLSAKADIRVALMAKKVVPPVKKDLAKATKPRVTWKQVAVVIVHGPKGVNTLKVAQRWHKHLVPGTTMQIRVQMKHGKAWKTRKTLTLTVRPSTV